jgi:hypothetical protein
VYEELPVSPVPNPDGQLSRDYKSLFDNKAAMRQEHEPPGNS